MAEVTQILYKFSKPTRLYTLNGTPAEAKAIFDIQGKIDNGLVGAGSQMWGSPLISLQIQAKNGATDAAFYRIYHEKFTFPVYVAAGMVEPVEINSKKLFYILAGIGGLCLMIYGYKLTKK